MENAVGKGETGFVGSIRGILAARGALGSAATRTGKEREVPAQTRRRAEAEGVSHGIRSHRVRTSHWLSVERGGSVFSDRVISGRTALYSHNGRSSFDEETTRQPCPRVQGPDGLGGFAG